MQTNINNLNNEINKIKDEKTAIEKELSDLSEGTNKKLQDIETNKNLIVCKIVQKNKRIRIGRLIQKLCFLFDVGR